MAWSFQRRSEALALRRREFGVDRYETFLQPRDPDRLVRPLPRSQYDCGGNSACTVIACVAGFAALRWKECTQNHQQQEDWYSLYVELDKAVFEGSKLWKDSGAGFLSSFDCLKLLLPLGQSIRLVKEFPCFIPAPGDPDLWTPEMEQYPPPNFLDSPSPSLQPRQQIIIGENGQSRLQTIMAPPLPMFKMKNPENVLRDKWLPLRDSTYVVMTQQGFSFLIFWAKPYYFCMDTHESSLFTRRSAFQQGVYFERSQTWTETKGFLFKTVHVEDIVYLIYNYFKYNEDDISANCLDLVLMQCKSSM